VPVGAENPIQPLHQDFHRRQPLEQAGVALSFPYLPSCACSSCSGSAGRAGRTLAGLSRLMSKVRRDRFIVQPETMLLWHRDLVRRWALRQNRRPGRPALPAGTVQLVMRLAWEDPTLGYRENHGEPATMGVGLAPSSMWAILRRHGVEASPKRSGPTWSELVGAQATTMLAGDFFHVDTVPRRHGAASAPLCALLHRARHPAGPCERHHHQSGGSG
jgi:hypothetical protein